ncbi:hypothetical protein FG071_05740 [Vibrio cholerae]|nr:hypothetical protein [Vibrio cholerae]
MKNKQIPIKFILGGLISMYGSASLAMTIYRVGDFTYGVYASLGELSSAREPVPVDTDIHGKFSTLTVGSDYKNGTYTISYTVGDGCEIPNPRPYDHYILGNPNYDVAMNELTNVVNSCRWELDPRVGDKLYYLDIYYASSTPVPDRPGEFKNVWFRFMDGNGEIGTPPTQCQFSLSDDMRFGIVSGPGPYKSETNMSVKCSQKTAFNVKVNNSREFIDNESGARITFDDFSSGRLALDCTEECNISIAGEMTAAPTKPGKYQWSVPVIVEYK